MNRTAWTRIAALSRQEAFGGLLLLLAAAAALIWANSGASDAYHSLADTVVGPESLGLNLSLSTWAADGLLAIFFFVVGIELKHEFVDGELRDPRRAALPVTAAVGGMALPALIYVAIAASGGSGALHGWAIPTATDIAFAVAVLAVVGSHLPPGLRTFLLTLAVVDDLLAVTVIAVFYSDGLQLGYLVAAAIPLVAFGFALRRGYGRWWLLLPLAGLTWWLVHESGVHATIAGVLLGFAVPVRRKAGAITVPVAEAIGRRFDPLSSLIVLPVFAFFAAGVTVGGWSGLGESLRDPIALGVIAGLVLGKVTGIVVTAKIMFRLMRLPSRGAMGWLDLIGIGLLGGIGFTVSLLIGDLAFGAGSVSAAHAKVGILCGSLISALLASALLIIRNRRYRSAAST